MPEQVRGTLLSLRGALDAAVPAKLLDRNLLIATWRWPMVMRTSDRWVDDTTGATRDQRAVHLLAEVARRFDVLAVQGLMADAPTFHAMVDLLGPDWAYLMTGLSRESTYRERTAVLFDTRKVLPHGLAGQIVIPRDGKQTSADEDFLSDQFFRPPFFAGFRCLDSTFTLVNQHIVFGTMPERVREIQALGVWLQEMHSGAYRERNLIVLGQEPRAAGRDILARLNNGPKLLWIGERGRHGATRYDKGRHGRDSSGDLLLSVSEGCRLQACRGGTSQSI